MIIKKIIRFVLIAACIPVFIYVGIALGLVLSQWPEPLGDVKTFSFDATKDATRPDEVDLISYDARDGTELWLRYYPSAKPNAPLIVVIHGSGWHGGGYTDLAMALAEAGEVLLPDLRGHGPKTNSRGDVDYIGQLEDDLTDLIGVYRKTGQKVILVGHSSGGGLAIRFAGGADGSILHKVVLLSPFLKYDAPTMRYNAGGWAHALVRRIIGLQMLNTIGISWFNGANMIQFNFPKEVLESPEGHTATQIYSYRLNESFAPRSDYLSDVAALPEFLLLAGDKDDAFIASFFKETLSPATDKGTYKILPDVTHIGISFDETAHRDIVRFIGN